MAKGKTRGSTYFVYWTTSCGHELSTEERDDIRSATDVAHLVAALRRDGSKNIEIHQARFGFEVFLTHRPDGTAALVTIPEDATDNEGA